MIWNPGRIRTGRVVDQEGLKMWRFLTRFWTHMLVIAAVAGTSIGTAFAGVESGDPAPAIRARTVDGRLVDTGAMRGRVLVLNFWATFCGPCRHEGPMLQRVHARLVRRGGMVVGLVAEAESLRNATSVARRWGMRFAIVPAEPGTLRAYGVRALPMTVVVGRDGHVVALFDGTVNERRLERAISRALRR